ncbi:U-box domain-containing protein 35 isoform X2 [Ricinus communis]|uniref:U-box domain-containing protein 35 isoform X2 n=1 Tax=Ricinus communis TaxID=3988 RepID=UPI00201A40E4|nr:U-box domain-containing protein 35 isoform X2 [Ricinus communis]
MSAWITKETGHLQPEEEEEETSTTTTAPYHNNSYTNWKASTSEIEEENSSYELFEISHDGVPMETIQEEQFEGISMFSLDVHSRGGGEDCVYVAVGKSESSMDAVSWTLKNLVNNDSTVVYLIHIYPEIHHIPSPLGKLPKNQVSPEQVEIYMAQERGKRRELLQKFIRICSASKVKVDTMLIESDNVAKAIMDLIPILNIKKLVLGTTKSGLRLRARKGSGIADQILQNASEFCDIKVIYDGKEVMEQTIGGIGSPSPSPRANDGNGNSVQLQDEPNNNDSFSCMCFKSPRVM